MSRVKPSLPVGIYRHYKGNEYEVLDIVSHSETEEWLVLYRPCYRTRDLWVRPYNMFIEKIQVDGKETVRFEYQGTA